MVGRIVKKAVISAGLVAAGAIVKSVYDIIRDDFDLPYSAIDPDDEFEGSDDDDEEYTDDFGDVNWSDYDKESDSDDSDHDPCNDCEFNDTCSENRKERRNAHDEFILHTISTLKEKYGDLFDEVVNGSYKA